MKEKILDGKLNLYSDQGMEGGCLAIMDKEFINLTSPTFGVTENRKVWDKKDISRFGITSEPEIYLNESWLPWPDPICNEPDYKTSSLYCGEVRGDLNADKKLMDKYNFRLIYSEERANEEYGIGNWKFTGHNKDIILKNGQKIPMGGTPNSIPERPYGISKDGLTKVTVQWNDGTIETNRLSNTLLVEQWDFNGLNFIKETDYIKVKSTNDDIICEGQVNLIALETFSRTMKGHFDKIKDNNNWEKYFTEKYYAELYREIK